VTCACSMPPARSLPRCTSRSRATGREGNEVILIGHRGHPEVEGTMGQYAARKPMGAAAIHLVETVDDVARLDIRDPTHVAFVTQTTLSMDDTAVIIDALKARFPGIVGPKRNDICYATPEPPGRGEGPGAQVRPGAGRRLAEQAPTRTA